MMNIIEEKKTKYIALIKKVREGKKIVIYGAGKIGKGLADWLKTESIHISYFCVTDGQFNLSSYKGIPIKPYNQLRNDEQNIYIIGVKPPQNIGIAKMLDENNSVYIDALPCVDQIVDDKFFRPALEITPRAGCTINCHYCPQEKFLHSFFDSSNQKKEMNFDIFKMCVDKTPQNTVIEFAGFVEPFLAKDVIKMMEYTYETGREMTLFTTLVGCDVDKFHKIEDLPFRYVVLHLPDIHNYANIPITDAYIELLYYLLNKRKPDGSPFIDKANCQAEPNPIIAKMLKDKVMISWDLVDRAGNLQQESALKSNKDNKGSIYCDRAACLDHNILLPDGRVVLCCMDFGMNHVLGNLLEDSWKDIHSGEEMKKIKAGMCSIKSTDTVLCRRCTSGVRG